MFTAHTNFAFDLDDTLIATGECILKIIADKGYRIIDEREPYNSLRHLLDKGYITEDRFHYFFNMACDWAEPIQPTLQILQLMLDSWKVAHVVSTRTYVNESIMRAKLSRFIHPDQVANIQFHWCKKPSQVIQQEIDKQGIDDAKLATFKYLSSLGVNAFMDDLMFNIKTLIENVPSITPVLVHQPWVTDKRYLPELQNHPSIVHYYL